MDKEYLAIAGNAEFCKLSIKLALGEHSNIVDEGLVSITCEIYSLRKKFIR